MIIKCQLCHSSFNVSNYNVPTGESELRCSNCKGFFLFKKQCEDDGKLVLIANESKQFCLTVMELLEKSGFSVEWTNDGTDAFFKIKKLRPDVVIIDVALPGMLGFQVCEEVRKIEEIKNTKILLVTATYDSTKYKRAPVSLYGADDYIEKHQINDLLVRKVESLLVDSPEA